MSDSIKLTNSDVLNVYSVLLNMKGSYVNKMKYALKRNKDLLEKVVNSIREKSVTKIEKLKEYDEKRTEKVKEYAAKTEDGRLVQETPDTVKIQEDKIEEFKAVMKTLTEEYKEELEQRRKEVEDFNKFLLEEATVEVYKFSNELVPNELSQEQYEILFPLIND